MQRAKRRRTEVNYRRLNEGVLEIAQTHPHTAFFHDHGGGAGDDAAEPDVAGFFARQGTSPVRIAKRWFPKLEMRVDAARFSPRAITEELGEDLPVPVMDSVTQQSLDGWTLGRWRDYLEMPAAQRRELTAHGTLNLISLEFSGTPLADAIERPRLVREHDLVDRVWPAARAADKPKVQLYSLTSAAQSFTDFHLDFAGTSVFYHVVSGAKSFIFVRPTDANLRAYERWCASSDQQTTWFPSTLSKQAADVFQIDLGPGDSMLIPSGWIHAVLTPADSSVVGGNFLLEKDMAMQKHVDLLEQRVGVAETYRFPHFDTVCQFWEAAKPEAAEPEAAKTEAAKTEAAKPEPETAEPKAAEPDASGHFSKEDTRKAETPRKAENAKEGKANAPLKGDLQLRPVKTEELARTTEEPAQKKQPAEHEQHASTKGALSNWGPEAPLHAEHEGMGARSFKTELTHENAEVLPVDAGPSSRSSLAAVELNDALNLVRFSQHGELGLDESRLASALLTLAENESRE